MSDDGQLLQKFAETRDHASFEILVRRHIGFVYAVCLRRLRDPHTAHDATQAVFIALARKSATVAHVPSVMGWLHKSACYETRNLMRAQANRLARETEALQLGTTTAQSNPDASAIGVLLDDALNQLSNQDREAILARYFSGKSYSQIGESNNLSENAARMRVDRAVEKLRSHLVRKGITCTALALGAALPAYASTQVPANTIAAIATASVAASTATTGIATIVTFMSTAKIITGALLVATIGGLVYQHQKVSALETELAAAHAKTTATEDRLRAVEEKLDNTLKARPAATPSIADFPSGIPVATAKTEPPPGVTPKAPKGWFKNGSANNFYEVGVDSTQTWGDMPSAYAKSTGPVDGKFGGMMQTISAERFHNQRVQLSGWIKTEDANDGGGHLWMRVDGPEKGKNLGFDNMEGRAPKGTTDWQEFTVVLDVPAEATTLNYGFFVQGQGKMWVNGIVITPVGPEVPSTQLKPKPAKPLPATPVNLGFSPQPAS